MELRHNRMIAATAVFLLLTVLVMRETAKSLQMQALAARGSTPIVIAQR